MTDKRRLTATYDEASGKHTLEITDAELKVIAELPAETVIAMFKAMQPIRLNVSAEELAHHNPDRLLDIAEVMEKTGWSKSKIMKDMARGEFPATIKKGSGRWRESEVQAFVRGNYRPRPKT